MPGGARGMLALAAALLAAAATTTTASVIHPAATNSSPQHEPLVEACCCAKSEVDAALHDVRRVLDRLVRRPQFRYYKANLAKECPYWAVELMCGMGADGGPAPCQVCSCDEHEVPVALRHEAMCGDLGQSRVHGGRENEVPIDVDFTVPAAVSTWADASASSAWALDDDRDPGAVFVDLVRNPEANTGYVGEGARRVWRAIYSENCFHGDPKDMCVPERAFFRLLSGLHVSISTHVAARFYRRGDAPLGGTDDDQQWDPNLELFMRTVGNWPDRVDNLYFLYMFVLRAVSKARGALLPLAAGTGDLEADAAARADLEDLLRAPLLCTTTTFNETMMFQGVDNKEVILRQMRSHFLNISRLMDCLSCEKCRLWGKLETHGLGTALHLVIGEAPVSRLGRPEGVALLHLCRQLTTAVHAVQRLLRLHNPAADPWATAAAPWG